MLGHNTSPNKYKRVEIVSSIVSNQNGMKLEINYRNKNGINTKTWRLNNTLLKNQYENEEIKRKSENTSSQIKMEALLSQIYGVQQKQF